jgi:hypothetical protein
MAEQIFWLLILSIVAASVAWTVTQEEIFREPREYCFDKSQTCDTLFKRKLFYVFTCDYCFSHWVTLCLVVLTDFRLLINDWRGYVLAFFAVAWMANQLMSFYRRLRVEIKKQNAVAEVVREKLENE